MGWVGLGLGSSSIFIVTFISFPTLENLVHIANTLLIVPGQEEDFTKMKRRSAYTRVYSSSLKHVMVTRCRVSYLYQVYVVAFVVAVVAALVVTALLLMYLSEYDLSYSPTMCSNVKL